MLRADTWLILSIGAVVGYPGYRLMVDPLSRRPEFRGRAYTRRAGTIVGGLPFGLCAVMAWLNLR